MWRRLKYWLDNSGRETALREEMELHLAERAAELQAAGVTAEEARAEARRQFGNVGLKQEEAREVWMTQFWGELVQDVRYGCRSMLGNKAFSLLAVLSLALGIGANTAIYSLMEAVMMRSLPVSDPDSLVVVNWQSGPPMNADKKWEHVVHGVQGMMWPGQKGKLVTGMFPYRAFEVLRENNQAFATLFGYFKGFQHSLTVNGQAKSASVEYVTGEYFRGLAVKPAAGRLIVADDDRAGAAPVAVLSFAASQNRFGGPANAIGQVVMVDRVAFTVVGVAPPEFFGVDPAEAPELYLPMHTNLLVDGPEAGRLYSDANFYWMEMMGRLRPGVSMAQAQAELEPRFGQWVASTASTAGERANLPALLLNPGGGGLGSLRREFTKPLYVLLAMVGLILAITCANIANLLLARAAARRREMAVRLSLGAGRFRVVRQLLTESVMLAALGGLAGMVFAIWSIRSLTLLFAHGNESFTLHAELNWQVLAVTAALSVICGVLFGLAPALQATSADVMPALKDGRGGGSRTRLQQILVVAQIGMSFLILVASGLFVQTLNKLHAVPLGYARDNVLLFSVDARQAGHREAEIPAFYAELRKRLEAIPGVQSATLAHASLVNAGHAGRTYRGAMKIGAESVGGASVLLAGPRFLTTMQIPLLTGREIDERDQPNGPPVAVITERLARTYFGTENPVGRRILFVEQKREYEVVGVAANLRYGGLKGESPMTVMVPASQFPLDLVTFALRTAGDPLRYVNSVHEVVRGADARIPVTRVATQAMEIDRTISRELMFAKLCAVFALLALLTACVGLYGTTSYTVARQEGEIGIRMALGARRSTVVWMVLRRVLLLAAAGLAISVPVALVAFRLVKSLLFQTQPNDPATLGLGVLVLLMAATVAGYAPARRASRVDPLLALRRE